MPNQTQNTVSFRTATIALLPFLIFIAGTLLYRSVSEAVETREYWAAFERLETYHYSNKYGGNTVYFVRLKGSDVLVLPKNDLPTIKRLKRLRPGAALRIKQEVSERTHFFREPSRYYVAKAIYANNKIFDESEMQ
ncbi:hypothetical protein [Pseudomonas matsuisoli]|uniref:Uncharacterized protein n=1 Tax=Pseudomonas matsuisoli TaxID=1515666 RepID=A0A917V0S0_9PSED|nr:hypothetical protein [Pseudomonas matsuisoli]GGK06373.1 hypothetical protein GCM10009304_35590 [Pseudomonas matsuisoli]